MMKCEEFAVVEQGSWLGEVVGGCGGSMGQEEVEKKNREELIYIT